MVEAAAPSVDGGCDSNGGFARRNSGEARRLLTSWARRCWGPAPIQFHAPAWRPLAPGASHRFTNPGAAAAEHAQGGDGCCCVRRQPDCTTCAQDRTRRCGPRCVRDPNRRRERSTTHSEHKGPCRWRPSPQALPASSDGHARNHRHEAKAQDCVSGAAVVALVVALAAHRADPRARHSAPSPTATVARDERDNAATDAADSRSAPSRRSASDTATAPCKELTAPSRDSSARVASAKYVNTGNRTSTPPRRSTRLVHDPWHACIPGRGRTLKRAVRGLSRRPRPPQGRITALPGVGRIQRLGEGSEPLAVIDVPGGADDHGAASSSSRGSRRGARPRGAARACSSSRTRVVEAVGEGLARCAARVSHASAATGSRGTPAPRWCAAPSIACAVGVAERRPPCATSSRQRPGRARRPSAL